MLRAAPAETVCKCAAAFLQGWGWAFVFLGFLMIALAVLIFVFLVVQPSDVGLPSPYEPVDKTHELVRVC